jgi:eukaryotic-like serine/threonine-protein kinase
MNNPIPSMSLRPLRAGPGQPEVDLSGRTLGDYRLLRRVGQGGMGQVYLAEQISLKRKVALKLLRPELAASPTSLQRFKAEAEAVARATHANIVQVYAIGEVAGVSFMALEYVEGRNLREFVAKKGPPDILLAVSIMRQVAAALQRAGELGIIHRDIKPENILLTRKGEVKVADFGLSRVLIGDQPAQHLTQSGVTMGTPLYMSPEQVEGKPVDCRTDIYSFGVTAYTMMTGQPPFHGSTPFEVALQHVQTEPIPLATVRPDLPKGLCAIIHKMMAKSPDERYQTGRDLLRDLSRLRENLGSSSGPAPPAGTGGENTPSGSAGLASGPYLPAATASSLARQAPTSTEVQPFRKRWFPLLVVLSLVFTLGAGAAFGWLRHLAAVRFATSVLPAPDSSRLEDPFSQQKQERALTQAAEQYLSQGGHFQTTSSGLGAVMDLASYYLEQNRFDEAAAFFARLEALKHARGYHILGKIGRAIVMALRNEAKPSNNLFREVFPPIKSIDPKGLLKVKHPERIMAEQLLGQSVRLRFWFSEANHYNKANGVPNSEMNWMNGLPDHLRQAILRQ